MTESQPGSAAPPAPAFQPPRLRLADRALARVAAAGALSLVVCGLLVAASGFDPFAAFVAMLRGALGSPHQIGFALNRATPYLLAGGGVALCFRAGVINIGAEGQIALGGAGAAAVALHWPQSLSLLAVVAALAGGALAGAAWAGLATAIHLGRRVHEVLTTLLLNFIALLLVQQLLAGPLGQFGAGFLQSPPLPEMAWLWKAPEFGAHAGIVIALVAAAALSLTIWRTPFGFAVRVAGSSRRAAAYAGFSAPGLTWSVMLIAGALAGLAGAVEVIGVQHRLIEGFSAGFGFKAVTVALLGALEPLAVVPAALFVGMLEAGAQSMQRQIGVPSALVVVVEGVTMLLVLAAMVRRA
jgi:simple sugar transport system permease protein